MGLECLVLTQGSEAPVLPIKTNIYTTWEVNTRTSQGGLLQVWCLWLAGVLFYALLDLWLGPGDRNLLNLTLLNLSLTKLGGQVKEFQLQTCRVFDNTSPWRASVLPHHKYHEMNQFGKWETWWLFSWTKTNLDFPSLCPSLSKVSKSFRKTTTSVYSLNIFLL